MARTTRATTKSKQRRKEAKHDWKEFNQSVKRAGFPPGGAVPDETASAPGPGTTPKPVQSGLVVKRPGMTDLNLDDLANCPTPDDALLLLSAGAAEAMQTIPEPFRLEVCKTIVALGDVVARTHEPLFSAIKIRLSSSGALRTTVEANSRKFHDRADANIVAALSGAVCAFARMEAKQRSGSEHAKALEGWGTALVEAGQYLAELAATARSIGEEIAKEQITTCGKLNTPRDGNSFVCGRPTNHKGDCFPHVTPQDAPPGAQISPHRLPPDQPFPWPHGEGYPPPNEPQPGTGPDLRSLAGRGGREMCNKMCALPGDETVPLPGGVKGFAGCMLDLGHDGECSFPDKDPVVDAIADRILGKTCGKNYSEANPGGCVRPKGHIGAHSDDLSDLVVEENREFIGPVHEIK